MTELTAQIEPRLKNVAGILKDLLKVIKVVSIYPDDNPLPASLKQMFSAKLVEVIDGFGDLDIKVEKAKLMVEGQVVFKDSSKEESLAALFFDTGITEIAFKSGLTRDEVFRFLDVIRWYINAPRKSEDLAAGLWEADLPHFKFATVEDVSLNTYEGDFELDNPQPADSSDPFEEDQEEGSKSLGYDAIFEPPVEEHSVSLQDSSISNNGNVLDDFFPTKRADDPDAGCGSDEATRAMGYDGLKGDAPEPASLESILNDRVELSQEEEKQIEEILRTDAEFDMYESVGELLREMLLQEKDLAGFYEVVTTAEKVLSEFVHNGRLFDATNLLRYLRKLEQKLAGREPRWADRVNEACVAAGSRERLAILADALNEFEYLGAEELKRYLDNFGWEALGAITDLLGLCKHHRHHEALCDYLAFRGKDRIDIVAKGIFDKRPDVIQNTTAVLVRIGDDRALQFLRKLVDHKDPEVRYSLATLLHDCRHVQTIELFHQLVFDENPDVKAAAIESIVGRRGPAAFAVLKDIAGDDRLESFSEPAQRALLNAYSKQGGSEAIPLLEQLIKKISIVPNSDLASMRKAAFEALSINPDQDAEALLNKLAGSIRTTIRNQARQMIMRRRSLASGEES